MRQVAEPAEPVEKRSALNEPNFSESPQLGDLTNKPHIDDYLKG